MVVKLYYRNAGNQLTVMQDQVFEGETVGGIIAETVTYLNEEHILTRSPVLALIQGGKA